MIEMLVVTVNTPYGLSWTIFVELIICKLRETRVLIRFPTWSLPACVVYGKRCDFHSEVCTIIAFDCAAALWLRPKPISARVLLTFSRMLITAFQDMYNSKSESIKAYACLSSESSQTLAHRFANDLLASPSFSVPMWPFPTAFSKFTAFCKVILSTKVLWRLLLPLILKHTLCLTWWLKLFWSSGLQLRGKLLQSYGFPLIDCLHPLIWDILVLVEKCVGFMLQ